MNWRVLIITLCLAMPASAFAVACQDGFCPIQPIPNIGGGGGLSTDSDLGTYLNALFRFALGAGAALAAIFIAIGGFEYIFSEAMQSKQDGRLRIMNALYGLGILLLVTMILYIIGGDAAINLDIFQ